GGRKDRRHLLHRHRRQERDHARAFRADEGRGDPLEHGPLQRGDRAVRIAGARVGDACGSRVRRGVHARRRSAALPDRGRAARQPRGGGGASGPRDGYVLREPGPGDRVCGSACGRARAARVSGAGRDRQGDRAAEARHDGHRDRRAHRGAGEVPRLVGRGDLGLQALILGAGYATRLYPLTQTVAKPLLPLAGRPMLDYLLDRIHDSAEIDEVHVVTNHKFAGSFVEWAASRGVVVHDDGTTSEDDRLGAIGDIQFVIDETGLDDDLLVVAGDNLFDYSVDGYVRWWQGK